ncbi:hypothetical protein Tfer_0864 [Thermincola ferriacetica]|uniref:YubB ferredoxin-like domain-containing protein n=1 Tax=Thermincola ferriacetica TaxID=281456 RepID=A0A0L6W5D1_9FIRM|nr:hypothetical protein [Thermincola ferriacetica]KNZ70304.1 hypothetical protein Tfer_0864 [Thermincola ferriacetica]
MPNWCDTEVIFSGAEENLRQFYNDFQEALKIIKDGDPGWIGRLFIYKGIEPEQENIWCRGFVQALSFEGSGDNCYVVLVSDDAWAPMWGAYDRFAEMYDLSYVLKAEEPGLEVYINTDSEGRFFPDKYVFEFYGDPGGSYEIGDRKLGAVFEELKEIRYFQNWDEIRRVVKKHGFQGIETLEDFKKLVEQHRDKGVFFYQFEE